MLHNDYLQRGGETQSVEQEAEGLRSIGVEVELLRTDNAEIEAQGTVARGRALIDSRSSKTLVSAVIKRSAPDVVHAQNLFPSLGRGAIDAIDESGIPWVRTLRNYRLRCIAGNHFRNGNDCFTCTRAAVGLPGIVHKCYRSNTLASFGAVAYAAREQGDATAATPDAYILLSEAMRNALAPVIRDAPSFVKANPVEPAKAKLMEFGVRSFDVAFVGRLVEEKDPALVIALASAMPDKSFAIAGDGPLFNGISAAASRLGNVTMLGTVTPARVGELLATSRAVVVPSRWQEPFGRVAAEALAHGAIPFASDVGGLREIVGGVRPDLLLARDAAPTAWTARIRGVLDSPGAAATALSAQCLRRWRSTYAPSANARVLSNIYAQVVETAH